MNRTGKYLSFIFLMTIFILMFSTAQAEDDISVLELNDGLIRIHIHAGSPDIETIYRDGQIYDVVAYEDWPIGAEYSLPFKSVLINTSASRPYLNSISQGESMRLPINRPFVRVDTPLGPDSLIGFNSERTATRKNNKDTTPISSLRYLGVWHGHYLWSVDVRPFQYDPSTGELIVYKDVLLEVHDVNNSGPGIPVSVQEKTDLDRLGVLSLTDRKTVRVNNLAKQSSSNEHYKILVERDGLYHITGKDLKAFHINLLNIDIKRLRLKCGGEDIPIYVHGWQDGQFHENDYFEFWGEYNRREYQHLAPDLYQDPFSRTNVYWLCWDGTKGQWMNEEQGSLLSSNAARPYSFYETVHVEEDNYFDRLNDIVEKDSLRDNWFYDTGISAGSKRDYEFIVRYPDNRSTLEVLVRVMMSGRTAQNIESHSVSIFLNDQYLMKGTGWRQQLMDLRSDSETSATGSDLNNGPNHLTIINEFDYHKSDFVMLNWFEVTYPRLYRAHHGFIKFGIPPDYKLGNFVFKVDGFDEDHIDIYKLGSGKVVGAQVEPVTDIEGFESLQISFQDYVTSHETQYVAVVPEAKLKPIEIVPSKAARQSFEGVLADYVIITHPKFAESQALEPLVELRQSQGHQIFQVTTDEIYDAFNFGKKSSYAIKDFLRYAYQNWEEPGLKHVLIVGDACYLRYPISGDTLDLVPTHFLQTLIYGAAASDYWYTLVDGEDELPDYCLGRLPVRSEDELAVLVDKIVEHESNPSIGSWRNRLLFVGGNGMVFRIKGRALAHRSPPGFESRMLFTTKDYNLDFDPFFGGTTDLLDYLDDGCAIVNFHGHGGGAIWSDNGLFKLEDVDLIANRAKYPFILSMTCFTGAFDSPSNMSLADAMLLAENKGTMAFLGASGLGWLENDDLLQKEIMNYTYENPGSTIGEIVNAGKVRYFQKYYIPYSTAGDIAISEVNQYSLLGDPASRLSIPTKGIPIDISSQTVSKGEVVTVRARTAFERGSGRFDLLDSTLVTVESKSVTIETNRAEAQFTLPSTFPHQCGQIRFYASDDLGNEHVHGGLYFSTLSVHFDTARVQFIERDSVFFEVLIKNRLPLKRVWCEALYDTIEMSFQHDGWYRTVRGAKKDVYISQLNYRFFAIDQTDQIFFSKRYSAESEMPVFLSIDTPKITWGGDSSTCLKIPVVNRFSGRADGVPVRLEMLNSETNDWRVVSYDTISVNAFQTVNAELPFSPDAGEHTIRITIDPDKLSKLPMDQNTFTARIRTEAFNCTPEQGITVAGSRVDTLFYDNDFSIVIKPGDVSENQVIFLKKQEKIEIFEQPDFKIIPDIPSYEMLLSKSDAFSGYIEISIKSEKIPAEGGSVGWYRFVPETRKWLKLPGYMQKGQIWAKSSRPGRFALFSAGDTEPPYVKVALNGRPYIAGTYTSPQPHMAISLQDLNGIDMSPNSFNIFLDGNKLDDKTFAMPDSFENGNQIKIEGLLTLSSGEHYLQINAADCNGNVIEPLELVLKVAEHFNIKILGNYPNPFDKVTTFAFVLTRPAETLSLKIYTAAGRLIRDLDPRLLGEDSNPFTADYHEITWDGTDKDGYEVANGVYFYKFSASSSGKIKEVTGKIARLQ